MSRRRILYIEDDPESMALVRQLLETSLPGVMVDVCTTEAGAETYLNNSCYDLIICDFCLPGTTTGAIIAEKVLARDPNQPFYLMSEYLGDNVKAEAERVGLKLHGKFSTVGPEQFLASVNALLEQRHCSKATAVANQNDRLETLPQARAERSEPTSMIRISSPYMMAALASLGRG